MKIDAVITWVDGNDPAHRRKRTEYAAPGMLKADDVAGDTRFVEVGELKWCVASINRYAPWVNKIYIVTDAQDPNLDEFMQKNFPDGYIPMEIVDHKVIFRGFEEYLPTFNACAIESMTWRIPGLNDLFLEFNDDVMLCAPVSPSDFITEDNKSVCYADKANIPMIRITRFVKKLLGSKKSVTFKGILANSAILGGDRWSMLRINHNPRALRRDFYQQYFETNPQVLIRNLRCRFRDPDMYLSELLQYTILNNNGQCVVRPVKGNLMYILPKNRKDYIRNKLSVLDAGKYLFCCFNSIDKASPEDLQLVRDWVTSNLKITL